MALRKYLAGEVVEDFADGLLTRREALRRLGLLGVTAGPAVALLSACAPTSQSTGPAGATPSATGAPPGREPSTKRGVEVHFQGPAGELRGAWAESPAAPSKGAVLVIHENRGLTEHFYDLVGRLAGAGYPALCVDLLSAEGGTAALGDPAQAARSLAAAPATRLIADLRSGIDELSRRQPGRKIGALGFCFGGGMTWQLLAAGEARLAAAVPFYGPAPDHADFSRARAAVLALYGALDSRVNATTPSAEAALRAAGLTYQVQVYDNADHAFFNDTGARYQPQAARAAWTATLDWFDRHLATT